MLLVVFLQTVISHGLLAHHFQAPHNGFGRGQGGDDRNPVFGGSPSDGEFIGAGPLPQRGIDDEIDAAVLDVIYDIGASFAGFQYFCYGNAPVCDVGRCSTGGR